MSHSDRLSTFRYLKSSILSSNYTSIQQSALGQNTQPK